MTRDLLIVSERALTASDLAASVAAVHQGHPWSVTSDGAEFAVTHCDRPVLRLSASERLDDDTQLAWRTQLKVIGDQLALGLEVARAMAWQASGNLVELSGESP